MFVAFADIWKNYVYTYCIKTALKEMFILLTSHNLLYGYINDKTIYLQQKEPFWAYGKFGFSLPQSYSTLCFMIWCR